MQPVDFYIRELLYEFDCVTIPGLGGFITQARPARLLRDRRRIYPPSRVASFNALLSNDDGLLANAISRGERMSYREAVQKIKAFSSECLKTLDDGRQVTFEGIGTMSCNPEGNLTFQPFPDVNLSASNYGLDSIFVHPVNIESPRRNRTKELKDRKPRIERKKSPAAVKWTVALSLPVIIFLLYGIIFPGSFKMTYTNYSGVAADWLKGDRIEEPAHSAVLSSEGLVEEMKSAPVISQDKTEILSPAAGSPEPLPVQTGPKYYIIGGCFENESNAYKFLDLLKTCGYDAELAGTNNRGHLRISYKSFPVKQEALAYLEEIKKQENPAAWLLKY